MDDFDHGRNRTPLPHPLTTFSWETKLKDLLPDDWRPRDQFQYEKTNLRDILSHMSGLAGYVNNLRLLLLFLTHSVIVKIFHIALTTLLRTS